MKRIKIKELLGMEPGAEVLAKGWVRTKRGNRQVKFIALNDGSTINNIQVVANAELFDEDLFKRITTGASLAVKGELVASIGSGQAVEIQAKEIEVLGECDPMRFPLQKKDTSLEYLRSVAHMRLRTNTFGAVLRIRHAMAFAIHKFFNDKGFVYLHTPLITESDAEGAGDMFQVTTMDLKNVPLDKKGNVDFSKDFFGKKTCLTVSGQLEGELGATAVGEIYTFGPTFRAENSNTPRHLAEFWMIEPEMAFYDIEDNMELAEEFVKYLVQYALDNCMDDLKFLNDKYDDGLIERLKSVLGIAFQRVTYTEAVDILEKAIANARALPRGAALRQAGHPDRLPQGHQGLLHEAERGRPHRPRHGRPLPEDRRDHRRLRARGLPGEAGTAHRRVGHVPQEPRMVHRHPSLRYRAAQRLRPGLRASAPLRHRHGQHP